MCKGPEVEKGSASLQKRRPFCVYHTEQRDSEGRWGLAAMLRILDFALPVLGGHR